jgi:putative methanogenesis marker protein 5
MAQVFIFPTTSLILSDLVARFGHTPLSAAMQIREIVQTPGLESPPLQITPEDPKRGLRWAAVEVPSGVRGRMSLYGPLLERAEAAIIVNDPEYSFGCMGCARTNELIVFLVRKKKMPTLDLEYPSNDEEGEEFVAAIKRFLDSLPGGQA